MPRLEIFGIHIHIDLPAEKRNGPPSFSQVKRELHQAERERLKKLRDLEQVSLKQAEFIAETDQKKKQLKLRRLKAAESKLKSLPAYQELQQLVDRRDFRRAMYDLKKLLASDAKKEFRAYQSQGPADEARRIQKFVEPFEEILTSPLASTAHFSHRFRPIHSEVQISAPALRLTGDEELTEALLTAELAGLLAQGWVIKLSSVSTISLSLRQFKEYSASDDQENYWTVREFVQEQTCERHHQQSLKISLHHNQVGQPEIQCEAGHVTQWQSADKILMTEQERAHQVTYLAIGDFYTALGLALESHDLQRLFPQSPVSE